MLVVYSAVRWPGITQDIHRLVMDCYTCTKQRYQAPERCNTSATWRNSRPSQSPATLGWPYPESKQVPDIQSISPISGPLSDVRRCATRSQEARSDPGHANTDQRRRAPPRSGSLHLHCICHDSCQTWQPLRHPCDSYSVRRPLGHGICRRRKPLLSWRPWQHQPTTPCLLRFV